MKERDYEIRIILKYLIEQEEFLLNNEEKEYKLLPAGTLITRNRNKKWYFALKDTSGERGITTNKLLVQKLMRKQFLCDSISKRKHTINILNNCLNSISSHDNLPNKKAFYNFPQSSFTNEELKWVAHCQSQNPYSPEHLKYKCNNGILVRSKSERTIANKLHEYGIVFKYEAPMSIDGTTLYPDFTILRNDGKIVLWEHNGLMSNEEYLIKALQKIRKYKRAGFTQHSNLICTEEDDITDETVLEEIILKHLLL